MLTDRTITSNKVLIPRNPKQFSFSSPLSNIAIRPSNTHQFIHNDSQKLFLLKVTDNKKQPHYIRLPSVNAINLVNQPNFDVRVEQVKAPIHQLDHSYAVNKSLNGDPKIVEQHVRPSINVVSVGIRPQQNTTSISIGQPLKRSTPKAVKKINVDTKPKPILIRPVNPEILQKKAQAELDSDKAVIAELRKQLKAKTNENVLLQKGLKRMQKESKVLVKKRLQEVLKNVFSTTQIEKILNPHKAKVKWTIEDIISALTLQNVSLKAYSFLRENNYPLPGLSTIRKWTAQINVTQGLLTDVLVIMKFRSKSLSIFQKIVILYFDELCITNEKCLFCIASGLFYKWMQPVYFSRNRSLSFDIISEIASQLYSAGFIVVALTCNLKSKLLWDQMKIGVDTGDNCYFLHPSNRNHKIFVFPDEFKLLTLIRRQFLDHGFVIEEKNVSRQCIEEIVTVSKKLESAKLSKTIDDALNDSESEKSVVVLAKQLFSTSVAEKILSYGQTGYIPYNDWKEAANFFEVIGKWINLFCVKSKVGCNEREEPYGLALENQNDILNKVKDLMSKTKIKGLEKSTSFQNQFILRGNSLRELLTFLKTSFSTKDFPINYILTDKLSSECLNNVIDYLTSTDKANSKPQNISVVSQEKFQNKLRKCVLGKYLSDSLTSHVWKILDPCLIDFNEKSEPVVLEASSPKEAAANIPEDESV